MAGAVLDEEHSGSHHELTKAIEGDGHSDCLDDPGRAEVSGEWQRDSTEG
jgi:hypothetical protein